VRIVLLGMNHRSAPLEPRVASSLGSMVDDDADLAGGR
jgi:hypothetical protein